MDSKRSLRDAVTLGARFVSLCAPSAWFTSVLLSEQSRLLVGGMSDLGKLMRQNGTPRFGFGIRGRFRRVGEHLPPCLPFGILALQEEDSLKEQKWLRCFQENDFVGFEYVERIKSSKP